MNFWRAFTFSCCLFVGRSAHVLSWASETHARLGWDLVIDSVVAEHSTSLLLFFVHLYRETPSNQICCIWLNLSRRCLSIHLTINSTASVFCHTGSEHQWPSANGSHACPCQYTATTMFCGVFWIMRCSTSPSFILPIILLLVDLTLCPKNAVQELDVLLHFEAD